MAAQPRWHHVQQVLRNSAAFRLQPRKGRWPAVPASLCRGRNPGILCGQAPLHVGFAGLRDELPRTLQVLRHESNLVCALRTGPSIFMHQYSGSSIHHPWTHTGGSAAQKKCLSAVLDISMC